MPSNRIYAQTLALSGLVICILLGCSLYLTDGHFIYAVDDAYIHLALAHNLPGHYGITAGIPAAASSSLIYPWLLMPFANFALAPFALNLLALAASLWLLCRISAQLDLTSLYPAWATAPVIMLVALFGNLYSMPLLGMEHSLHITAVLAILSGLIDLNDNRPLPRWFWVALILLPAIRLEGLAMFGLTLLWLFTTRYRAGAVWAGAMQIAIQLAHGAYLHSLNLPVVAGSILIKTRVSNTDSIINNTLDRLLLNLLYPHGWILVIISLFLLLSLRQHANRIALLALLCILAHFIGGRIVWSDRYHSYLLAFGLIALAYTLRPAIMALQFNAASRIIWAITFFGCGYGGLLTTAKIPFSIQDIYYQQVQFTHLVHEYWRGPVGVNDIGYISWKSPYPIYDIYGLGSEETRLLRMPDDRWEPAILADYAIRHNISLFIIYDEWFEGQIPANWVKVADFSFSRTAVNAAYNSVNIYLANPADAGRLDNTLALWEKTLPAGTTLVRHRSE